MSVLVLAISPTPTSPAAWGSGLGADGCMKQRRATAYSNYICQRTSQSRTASSNPLSVVSPRSA